MDIQQLEALGFIAFQIDNITLHAKEFTAIGYILCTSEDNTFSISTHPVGDILAKRPIEYLMETHNRLDQADVAMLEFKKLMDSEIKKLFNDINPGENE